MKKVIVRGPLLSISGYGVHARQVYRWVKSHPDCDVHAQITPWGNTPFMINPEIDPIVKMIMNDSTPKEGKPDLSLQIQLPNEWDPNLAVKNIGITAAVETDKCNPQWVSNFNQMDACIVPSKFTEGVIRGSGNVIKPLNVVAESFDDEIVGDAVFDYDFGTKFNFLVVSQLTSMEGNLDRKNIANTIKWICEVFKDDPDVGLVIKTNLGRATPIDRLNTINVLKKIVEANRKGLFPRIHFLHGALTTSEMGSLYRHPQVKALINLTRGEGFGLPILEAAVNDLPVIATNWSGHLDFMGLGKFVTVDYVLKTIPPERVDKQIFVEGVRWADPSEEDFKKRVRKFRSSHDVPKQWAASLGKIIRDKFNTKQIQNRYSAILGDNL